VAVIVMLGRKHDWLSLHLLIAVDPRTIGYFRQTSCSYRQAQRYKQPHDAVAMQRSYNSTCAEWAGCTPRHPQQSKGSPKHKEFAASYLLAAIAEDVRFEGNRYWYHMVLLKYHCSAACSC
jgi:hypothetical protein